MNAKQTISVWIVASLLWSGHGWASQSGDWQLEMLHQPSPAQLKMEKRGRVFIYEQLYDAEIELAMNTDFDRIERMMFVRTQQAMQDGDTQTADDGCD